MITVSLQASRRPILPGRGNRPSHERTIDRTIEKPVSTWLRDRFGAGLDFLPALGALLGVENFFAETDRFRRHFDVFIVGDEFDGFFKRHFARRDQANGFVSGGRAHVRLLFFFGDVHRHVFFAGVFAEDHAFVNFNPGTDEHFAAFLNPPDRVSDGNAGAISYESTRRTHGHIAGIISPAFENGMDQSGAARVGEKLAAQSDQASRWDAELHAHAAGMMVHHFFHFAATRTEKFHHDADEILRAVDDKEFERFHTAAVFSAHHDFRFANHQLVAFAAHRLDQDRKL